MESRQRFLAFVNPKTMCILALFLLASVGIIYSQMTGTGDRQRQMAKQEPLTLLYFRYQNALHTNNQTALKSILAHTSRLVQQSADPLAALNFRFSVYRALKMKSHALADLQHINKLAPSGERILMECAYYRDRKQAQRLNACYQRAITLFDAELTHPNEHVVYLLTKLLLNNQDSEARAQFSALLTSTGGVLTRDDYEFWGRDVLGNRLYQQLFETYAHQ